MAELNSTPGGWFYHPYEIALSGYSGSGKTTLAEKIISRLSRQGRRVGFFKNDAHRFDLDKKGKDKWRAREAGAAAVMIEDPHHSGLITDLGPMGTDEAAMEFAWHSLDVLLVEGKKRLPVPKLILLDPRGEIDRAMATERFEQVRAILYPKGERLRAQELAPFVPDATILCRDDLESILALLRNDFRSRVPPLKGIVLVGGLSTRMGCDKASMSYRDGESQARRSAELLKGFCDEVFLSAREGQELPPDCGTIARINDRFVGFGPIGGILTALDYDPFAAWFVLSCDLPFIETEDLRQLVGERDPLNLATAFCSQNGSRPEETDYLPEPLIAIYEPKARTRLLGGLMRGVGSPRSLLSLGGTKLVAPIRKRALFNANKREEYRQALGSLRV